MNSYHASGRHPTSNRFHEMLEAVKVEYDNLASEVSAYKSYKEDYEHKSESIVSVPPACPAR